MPQPGDGDLWPKNDDDRPRETPSTPVKDVVTHELPVPEAPKKPASSGWFDPPATPEPAAGRDKSHAQPTQPVSWPVAELEQQAKNPDAERTLAVRIPPTWQNSTQTSEEPPAGEPEDDQPATEKPEPAQPAETAAAAEPDEQEDAPQEGDSASSAEPEPSETAQPDEQEDAAVDGETASFAVPDQPEPSEPAETDAATQPDEQDTASESGDSDSSAEPETGETTKASQPTEATSPAEPDEQKDAPQDGDSASSAEAESDETAQASQPTEPASPVEPAEQESAPQDGDTSSAETESSETAQPSQPAEAAAATQSGEQESGEAEPDQPETDPQTSDDQPADEQAEADQPEAEHQPDAGQADPDATDSQSGSDSGEPDEPPAGDAQDTPDSAATTEKNQRGGDHPAVIGQVGGDGTRTGLRAVVVDKTSSSTRAEVHAWPDEQEDSSDPSEAGQESPTAKPAEPPVDLFQPSEPKDPKASWFDSQEDDRPATRDWPTDQEPAGDTTVNLAKPAAEPPRTTEPAETPQPTESARTVALPTPAEPPKPAEWPTSSEAPKTAESPATVGRSETDKPAGPVDRTEFVERSKVAERPQPTEPPRTSESTPARPTANDSATVYFQRPVIPPQADPPSFIRPRQQAENTTFIPRIPQQAQPDQRQERQQEWPPPEPPRAAPQRVGPQPQEPPAPRRKKPLLIAAVAVVAVLGLAAGVVFGVPGLAAKLGLAGEDSIAAAPPPAPITYRPGLHGPDGGAPKPTKDGVARALAGPISNPALGTVTGVVIDPATGETLYERDGGEAITPASTGKILTAAAALLSLDHTEQLVTKVVQGEQPGEVIIVGGGDPTISSLPDGEVSMYPGAAHLDELVEQVRNSGVDVQTVYVDQSRYTGPALAPSWLPADIGDGYIAPIVPAMLDGDREDPTVNYSPRTTDPGRRLAGEFARRIGATAASSLEKKAPANAKVLGELRSAPVAQLVDNMLDHSDNTLGDILAHEVAVKNGVEANFDGASEAMLKVLRDNGFDVDGVQSRDGSGMSIENKMPAKLLASILAVAAGPDGKDPRTNKLRPLLGGLPVAGGSGTLEERYGQDGAAAAGRGWVRAKTGTLTGVNSLAGIVLNQDNRPLVFAFLTSGTAQNTARPALDNVAAALRGCGCQ